MKSRSSKKARAAARPALAVISPRRRRAFRIAALLFVPALLLVAELALRIANVGYPTSFFLRTKVNGETMLIENRRFGWRFFNREAARAPGAMMFPERKGTNTLRVFVFGESAAYGDPQPEFGFPRMLDVLLRERFPNKNIEVINVAMTAINSHVVLPIARECARLNGDVWVVYMGNNEAVGPFGPATVFGEKSSPLWFVRTTIALKRSRVMQLVVGGLRQLRGKGAAPRAFGGMEMFADNKIAADDPRLARLYSHFEQNLRDIVAAGARARAEVLVCTVASNVKDCSPFASLGANSAEAAYRDAQREVQRGNTNDAAALFVRARDLDALRFRTDSKLNEIARRVSHQRRGVRLLDVEKLLSAAAPWRSPGNNFFYEHVHFNFTGNYFVASNVAAAIAQTNTDLPSLRDCAERLVWSDWKRLAAAELLFQRTSRAPFTFQFDHEEKQLGAARELQALRSAISREELQKLTRTYDSAIAKAPSDWMLHESAAQLFSALNDFTNAVNHCDAVTKLLPHNREAWTQLGQGHLALGRIEDAYAAFRHALNLDGDFAPAHSGIGFVRLREKDFSAARAAFTRALKFDPMLNKARVGLGEALVGLGKNNEALASFETVLKFDPADRAARAALNRLKYGDEANLARRLAELNDVVTQSPNDASLRLWLGKAFVASGQLDAAKTNFALAVQLDPGNSQAHYLLAQEFARENQFDVAVRHFTRAVELDPNDAETHFNLGVALARTRRFSEAAEHFDRVIRLDPTNKLAREYGDMARAQGRR